MTLVLDASALVHASVEDRTSARRLRARLVEERVHAPHLIDAELGNVLRRLVSRGVLEAQHGLSLLLTASLLVDERHDGRGELARQAWALRDRVTFYDGLYVALAAGLEVPLLTLDARLARAGSLPCPVELVE